MLFALGLSLLVTGSCFLGNYDKPHDLEVGQKLAKAEAAYFTSEEGMRTGLIFFDMADSSEIPSAAEPFFMGLDAKITFAPVMNVEEMRAGIGKAMQAD